MNKIKVVLSHKSHKEIFAKKLINYFSDYINLMLEEIKESVITFNAHVKVIETDSGNFEVEPVCDNGDLRNTMCDYYQK